MNATLLIVGMILGYLIIAIPKSIYMPGARKIQAIMFFEKLYTIIENVEGKKFYKNETHIGGQTKWDLIDLKSGEKKRFNIYFFLWPFFKKYTYSLTTLKYKKLGEQSPEDVIIFSDEKTKDILVSKKAESDHLKFRQEYPTVSINLDTKDFGKVNVYTNNMIEIINPALAFFAIENWLIASTDTISGAQRGLVAGKMVYELNQFSSEGSSALFNEMMKDSVNGKSDTHPGLGNFGLKLFKSVFKDFEAADAQTELLMNSYSKVTMAEEIGKATVKTAEQEAKAKIITANANAEAITITANANANAFGINQAKIVEWKKKYLVETGLAKTNKKGEIIELIPDANTKISAEAIKELSKLTGTLVMDSSGINKFLNINPDNKKEDKE